MRRRERGLGRARVWRALERAGKEGGRRTRSRGLSSRNLDESSIAVGVAKFFERRSTWRRRRRRNGDDNDDGSGMGPFFRFRSIPSFLGAQVRLYGLAIEPTSARQFKSLFSGPRFLFLHLI